MAGEIRQKIVLEGEKEYNAALKEAQRHLKTLRSELKAETAELGANATAQQKNEVRAKSLQAQIKEQEEVVKTLRQALEEAKEHYGDNEEVVAKWEQKLNDARTTLANMKNDLSGLNDNFANVQSTVSRSTTDVKSFADTLGEIGDIGSSVSGAIEGVFSGLVSRIRDAAAEIWGLIVDTAAAADNYGDLASYFGSSAYDVQKWSRAIEAAGGDLNTLTGIVTRLAYGGKNDKIAEYFGISDANYTDDLQYTLDVLTRMAEVQDEMKSKGTWNEAIAEIFGGKKAQDVQWFLDNLPGPQGILAWAEKYESEGWGNTQEELEDLGGIWKQINDIQTKWNDLKAQWAAGFGEVTGKLLIDVQGILGDLNAVLNAKDQGERDAALQALREHLESFFTTLAEAISEGIKQLNEVGKELQESTDPTVKAIGDLLVWITEKLQWLADPANKDAIMNTFKAIAAFWLTGQGVTLASKIAQIVANIAVIRSFNGASTAAAAAGGATTGTNSTLWGTIGGFIVKAVPWVAGLGVLFENVLKPQGNDDITTKEEEDFWSGRVHDKDAYERIMAEVLERTGQTRDEVEATIAENLDILAKYAAEEEAREDAAAREAERKAERDKTDVRDFWQMFETLAANMDRLYRGEDNPVFDAYYDQLPDELAAELDKWYELFAGGATPLDLAGNAEFTDFMSRLLAGYGMPLDTADLNFQRPLGFDFWGVAPYQGSAQTQDGGGGDTLVQALPRAVRDGIQGMKVEIDGQEAGRILTPWISQLLGREVEAYAP